MFLLLYFPYPFNICPVLPLNLTSGQGELAQLAG